MNDQNRRSALEVVADAARKIRAAVRIAKAASIGGIYGAAAAAAKEALPTLVKLVVGFVIAVVVLPMFVISAMPNMFFGYETSEKDPQITMREQALSIGGAYLSLEDFEKTQQDAIITGEAAAYENQGVTIDEIRVSSKFDDEDLCWYIAINSVAHKQDLSEMKPEEVQSLLISNLKHTTRLESSGDQTVLRIIFQPLDKDKLMDDLEFDEDAKTWAGALFETIYESDALGKYKDKFEAYKPNYAGDTSYTGPAETSPGGGGGGAESGGSADNTIDISGFTNPRTKNNHDLASYAIQAWEHGWGYVWGTFGTVLTESMLQYKLEQYPDIGASEAFIREHWLGRRTTDCVGLLKGYGWLNPDIRRKSLDTYAGLKGLASRDDSVLADKISRLIIWYSLQKRDLSDEDRNYLDTSLVECYRRYGITFDNTSVLNEDGRFCEMPVLADWYDVLQSSADTKHLAVVLARYVTGSASAMGSRNEIDLDNKYIVIDTSGMPDDLLLPGIFWATDIANDLISGAGGQLSALISDELWSLVGANSNPLAAGYIQEMVKTIRGLGGIAITSTQGMQDLFSLDNGKYGKGILDSSRIKIVMQMEEQEARLIQNVLNLSEEEVRQITRFRRGEGLLCIGYNHVPIAFYATQKEYDAITTSPTDLLGRKAKNETV